MSEGEPIRMIYVDDEEINLVLFRMAFGDHFEVITTISPIDALEIYKNNSVDLVLADYKMPQMNGMELIRKIKAINPETVCMILSGYLETDVSLDKNLIHCFIMKPWNKEMIIRTIKDAING